MICLADFYCGFGIALIVVFGWIFKKLAESKNAHKRSIKSINGDS
jgi:flagellar biogenesis protein FliO